MHTLWISTCVPPHVESSSIHTLYLFRALRAHSHTATAISPRTWRNDEWLRQEIPDVVDSCRTQPPVYDRIKRTLESHALLRRFCWWFDVAAYYSFIPDVRAGWDGIAARFGEKAIQSRRPDLIISLSCSPTAHMAAAHLAGSHRLPWLAILEDPWGILASYNWVAALQGKINRRLEMRTISRADAVLFTTEETRQAYQDWMGPQLPQSFCLPYGFSKNDFQRIANVQRVPNTLTFAYIGAASFRARNLIPTIAAMAAYQNRSERRHSVNLHVIGSHSQRFTDYARDRRFEWVTFMPHVSYLESLRWMLQSDVLVLVGNRGTLQIPGKVFAYLGSGKPILYIRQEHSDSDPTLRLLKGFRGVVVATQDEASIAQAVTGICESYPRIAEDAALRAESADVVEIEEKAIGRRFCRLLERITTKYQSTTLGGAENDQNE